MPEGTPETLNYLILGLVVSFVLMGGWLATLYSRHNNLRKDVALIEQLKEDE